MWKILLDRNGNKISTKILNLKNTLLNGQSFNWRIAEPSLQKSNNPNHKIEYIGYIGRKVLLLKEDYITCDSKILKSNNILEENLNDEEKYVFYKFLNLISESIPTGSQEEKVISKLFSVNIENPTNTNNKEKEADELKNKSYKINLKTSLNNTPNKKIDLKGKRLTTEEESLSTSFKTNAIFSCVNSTTPETEIFQAFDSSETPKEPEENQTDSINELILDYFQMEVDLNKILSQIAPKLPINLGNVIANLAGVRIIKQDVFECTLSFICSSNNNIERIRKMLLALRENYGELILNYPIYGKIYAFPTLENLLLKTSEKKLRKLGFGYRAKYIVNSLSYIESKGLNWLYGLEFTQDPWKQLVFLTGVGRKVADCISLFSLKKHQIVPLDIHMIKFYNETIVNLDKKFKKIENLNKQVYENVSKIYVDKFGEYAGWVHLKEIVKINSFKGKNKDEIVIKKKTTYVDGNEIGFIEEEIKKKIEVSDVIGKNRGKVLKSGKLKAEESKEDSKIIKKKNIKKVKV
jgi:N-glycosylase/DNA lyase